MENKNILSINFNHDGSACIISNGKLCAYVNTERFSKIKKHPGIRTEDLNCLLVQASLRLEDIDFVILCNLHNMDTPDIPHIYGSNLKETWMDFWINQTLDKVLISGIEFCCLVNPDHQLLHSALAYFSSPFSEAICFSWDPSGYAVFIGRLNKLRRVEYQAHGNNSCTWYSDVATSLFGTGIVGAGKVMGLAPYGFSENNRMISDEINSVEELYDYSNMCDPVFIESGTKKLNATLAYNVQAVMERQLKTILDDVYAVSVKEGVAPNLCLGGGGALNSVANQVAFEASSFKNLYIHPASGDDGTSIGAGMWYWHHHLDNPKIEYTNCQRMYSVASYDEFIDDFLNFPDVRALLDIAVVPDYIKKTAQYISMGKIIAWFQNASEIGPRSLGNRSILADPRDPDMIAILNARIKFREQFRPFAPSVLNDFSQEWFGLKDSPFMLRVCNVLKNNIPAVTHVDCTARIQTVREEDNVNFYRLIHCFYDITGVPLLLNTSFNIKGEPIVETPQDAINSFLKSSIDFLVFKNRILSKKNNANSYTPQ